MKKNKKGSFYETRCILQTSAYNCATLILTLTFDLQNLELTTLFSGTFTSIFSFYARQHVMLRAS